MGILKRYSLLVVSLASFTACSLGGPHQTLSASPGDTGKFVEPAAATIRHLGPEDVFEIHIYEEEKLSGTHRISSSGTIDAPLIGRVRVAGLNTSQLVDILKAKYRAYLKSPQVSVFVKEFKSKKIYVFGKVNKPGTFSYEGGMNIVQAITLAGGFNTIANQNATYVNRVVDGIEKRIEVSVSDIGEGKAPNLELRPGDIVYVPESIF